MTIRIITGSKNSGKTAWCRAHLLSQPGLTGILQDKVYDQTVFIGYDTCCIPSGRCLPFLRLADHLPPDWQTAEKTGPFRVSRTASRQINHYLYTCFSRQPTSLLIDEIGPLELGGGGLAPALTYILAHRHASVTLILVIRNNLVDEFCRQFKISDYSLTRLPLCPPV